MLCIVVDWIVDWRRRYRYHKESFRADAGSRRDAEKQTADRHHSAGLCLLYKRLVSWRRVVSSQLSNSWWVGGKATSLWL